jgi:hypothetical protein
MTVSNEWRRARRKAKKERDAADEAFWKRLGPSPADNTMWFEPNIPDEPFDVKSLSPPERAPCHMIDPNDEHGGMAGEKLRELGKAGGKARGEQLQEESKDRADELRRRYPDLIGKRGAARLVRSRELKRLRGAETAEEQVPAIRTLQRYFARTAKPKSAASQVTTIQKAPRAK